MTGLSLRISDNEVLALGERGFDGLSHFELINYSNLTMYGITVHNKLM